MTKTTLDLSIIAAIGWNQEMGKDGDLMWHLPHDMKRFQRITSGHPIVMGRKTFESFNGTLPNRKHIILTRKADYSPDAGIVVHSVEEALTHCERGDENFVIGGAAVYEAFLPYANRMYLTHIHASFAGADTYFPSVDYSRWREINRIDVPRDDKHAYAFTYVDYERRK